MVRERSFVARARWSTTALLDSVLIGAGILLYLGGAFTAHGDSLPRMAAVAELAYEGRILPIKYSMIGPLFSVPLAWLERATDFDFVIRYNALVFCLGLGAFWYALKDRLGPSTTRRFILLLLTASMFTAHTRFFYGEVFTAVLVATGLLAVAVNRGAAGWPLAILGVAGTPATLVGLAAVSAKKVFETKRFRYLSAIVVAVLLIFLETKLRIGSWVDSEYLNERSGQTLMPYSTRPGFSYPLFFGVLSLLLSFGKGLLFFAPGLFFPVGRFLKERSEAVSQVFWLWMVFLLGILLIYAQWWHWPGGWFWGPRFLLFASIPACLALAVRMERPSKKHWVNWAVLVALVLSVWVGVSGFAFRELDNVEACLIPGEPFLFEPFCWYTPEFSVLWRPWVVWWPMGTYELFFAAYAAVVLIRMIVGLAPALSHSVVAGVADLRRRWNAVKGWGW